MSDNLSKDEVDALLQGMKEGGVPVDGEPPPPGTVQAYDLVGEDRLAGRRFPALDQVHERLLRRLPVSLATLLGATPTLTLGTCETVRFATFRNRIAAGTCLQLFTMLPLRGQALLALSAPLAFALIDRVFGGPGRVPDGLEGREFSAIELQTLQRVGARILGDLAEAWAPVQKLECAFVRLESNPAYLMITGPSEAVVAVEIGCDLGAGAAPLVLALPYAMLEPLRERLGAPQAAPVSGGSDREWLAAISGAVRHAQVDVSAELGRHEISARELLQLGVGDVVPLDVRGDDPVALRVDGIHIMTGLAGVSRGQNAVRVVGARARRVTMAEQLSPQASSEGERASLDLILDVPLAVSVELGRVRMTVRELLALGAGSVIELAKAAGEPLDVLINGRPVARGEAVMVNEKFGVRLTEIVSPTERVERLR